MGNGEWMIIDHGRFSLYTPDEPNPKFKAAGALFLRNQDGRDWYELAHLTPVDNHIYVCIRDGGEVCAFDPDISKLWPIDMRVIETDQLDVGWGMFLVDDKFIIPVPPAKVKTEPDFDG